MRGKVADQKAEVFALQSMLDSPEDIGLLFAAALRKEHFYSVEAQSAFDRISSLRKLNRTPMWENILADVAISLPHRKRLEALSVRNVASTKTQAAEILDSLESLRKVRTLYDLAKNISDTLTSEYGSVDVSKLVEDTASFLQRTSTVGVSNSHSESHSDKVVHRLIKRMREGMKDRFIPTGMKEFDKINGGMARGSAVTIGAPSGEGKSQMAQNIALYTALQGYRVAFYSLEMPEDMVWQRALAWLAGVTVNEMTQHELSVKKYQYVQDCYDAFQIILKRMRGCFRVEHPQRTPTMQQLLAQAQPYQYDVIVIDYLTLLDGMSGKDFWQHIGDGARLSQAHAINNDNVVINVVQTDEEGNARLSQQIKDNAGLMWVWESSKKRKQNPSAAERPDFEKRGIDSFRVQMPKTRMQVAFEMTVFRSKGHMQMSTDVNDLQKPRLAESPLYADAMREVTLRVNVAKPKRVVISAASVRERAWTAYKRRMGSQPHVQKAQARQISRRQPSSDRGGDYKTVALR